MKKLWIPLFGIVLLLSACTDEVVDQESPEKVLTTGNQENIIET